MTKGKKKIQHQIWAHYRSLSDLFEQSSQKLALVHPANAKMKQALRIVSESIYQMMAFFELHFESYLDLDFPASDAFVKLCSQQLEASMKTIKSNLFGRISSGKLPGILWHSLSGEASDGAENAVTLGEIFYKKKVLSGLEKISTMQDPATAHDALVALLVYLNFNSRSFLDYYTEILSHQLNQYTTFQEKTRQLLLARKQFFQMHRKPRTRLSAQYPDVKKVIGNWFSQEIRCLEKQIKFKVLPLALLPEDPVRQNPQASKVQVNLSLDQIALFFRAMDSLRIISAGSLSSIFQNVAPMIATARTQQVRWESLRRKAYSFEENDKQVVIRALESVIETIKEF